MVGRDAVLALETRLVNAWPSFETQMADGWMLRFAEGYSKRANSASPMLPGAELDAALADHIVAQFARRGLRPVFRLTGLEEADVDARLAARGLLEIEPSLGLVAPLSKGGTPDPAIRIETAASTSWIRRAAAAYGGDKADDSILARIVGRITQPAAFATLTEERRDLAWGLAVAERGHVGLYDIVVSPEARGRGLGRRLVASLMQWGEGIGAATAYLQVREDNGPARRLYHSLGFTTRYRYTHRVARSW